MTYDEFVRICSECGYATTAEAKEYAKGRDDLTEADFVILYRKSRNPIIYALEDPYTEMPRDIWN